MVIYLHGKLKIRFLICIIYTHYSCHNALNFHLICLQLNHKRGVLNSEKKYYLGFSLIGTKGRSNIFSPEVNCAIIFLLLDFLKLPKYKYITKKLDGTTYKIFLFVFYTFSQKVFAL